MIWWFFGAEESTSLYFGTAIIYYPKKVVCIDILEHVCMLHNVPPLIFKDVGSQSANDAKFKV